MFPRKQMSEITANLPGKESWHHNFTEKCNIITWFWLFTRTASNWAVEYHHHHPHSILRVSQRHYQESIGPQARWNMTHSGKDHAKVKFKSSVFQNTIYKLWLLSWGHPHPTHPTHSRSVVHWSSASVQANPKTGLATRYIVTTHDSGNGMWLA